MKRIHILLCVLFGMTVGSTTLCSDETDDEYQSEGQDTDDESFYEDEQEIAQQAPAAVVATPSSPAQSAPPPEKTPEVTPAQTAATTAAQAAITAAQDTSNNLEQEDAAGTQADDDSNNEDEQEQASSETSTWPENETPQNTQSTNTSLKTSNASNQISVEQQAQSFSSSSDHTNKEGTAASQPSEDATNSIDEAVAAAIAMSHSSSGSAITENQGESNTQSTDFLAQQPAPATTAQDFSTTPPDQTNQPVQQESSATAGNIPMAEIATNKSPDSGQPWTAPSVETAVLTPPEQTKTSDKIDIQSTDAETIVSSFGTLPRPRKLSDLLSPETHAEEPLEPALSGPLTKKSIGQAIAQLAPLIMSRSVEKAVEQFTNLPAEKALAIVQQLIKTSKTDFTKQNKGRPFEVKRNDFLQILFGVASQYHDPAVYNRFFDLIEQYPGLRYGIRPILFVLSISSYPALIPDLIRWLEAQGVKNSVQETGIYAIDRTSARSIHALANYDRSATEPVLGSLLLYAISKKKPIKMVRALVDAGADPNYVDASGYTPLIKAVEMGNPRATKLLVEHGGDIDLIVKDEIGSAWQKSSELPKSTIMEYLQKNAPNNHKPINQVVF